MSMERGESMPKATLVERSDGRYRCKYKGKEFYGNTQSEAFAKRDAYKDMLKRGLKAKADGMTVKEYSAKWLPTHRSDVKKQTYNTYAHYIDVANSIIGDLLLKNVTPSDIRTVYNYYSGKSQSSIDKMVILMNSMFESAHNDGYSVSNPCKKVDKPKGTDGSHRALEPWEDEIILAVDHPLRNAVLIMRYAGLRRGEVLALTSDDIDFDKGIIHVTKAISFDGNKAIEGLPKTEAGIRDVPIFERLKNEIKGISGHVVGKKMSQISFKRAWESYVNRVEAHINGCQKRWYGRRRCDKTKDPIKYNRIMMLVQEAKKLDMAGKTDKAKIKLKDAETLRLDGWKNFTVRTHDLRHSYVTMLCDANVEIDLAMEWVGHSDEKMIRQIYDHVSDYRKKKATKDVEALLNETSC